MAAPQMSKNQMRRAKKKQEKQAKKAASEAPEETQTKEAAEDAKPTKDLEVRKVDDGAQSATTDDGLESWEVDQSDPTYAMYRDLFAKLGGAALEEDGQGGDADGANKGEVFFSDDDQIPDDEDEAAGQTRLSNKKRKQMNKLSIAELKALVKIPEVVEWQDTSSPDPRMLVQIKSQRNVVPVPAHWSLKREYLSSKRGIEKSAFRLPQFIAETGIAEMRDAVLEKQAEQTLKQKQRERVAPKMGRLDIDYQKLYDAFFRFQTKPELTRFGEVYYEGKEAEVDYKSFRPGDLSEITKEALGMPPGAPPPWLINQQRIGPPPSYPTLKIPGLNAPPPPGGSWGFHAGGWGKPPIDEFNRPLFGGDVFGFSAAQGAGQNTTGGAMGAAEPVEKTLWGELQPREEESEEEEEEEDDDEEEEEGDEDADIPGGTQSPSGLETPGGMVSSVPTDYPSYGVETSVAGELDLRKDRRGTDTEDSAHPRNAYTILQEKAGRADGFFGSDRTYDINGAGNVPVLGRDEETRKRKKPGDVDVAIDVDSLQQNDGLSKDEVRRRFEERSREEGVGAQWNRGGADDGLSEMIAQEARKRQKLDEKKREGKRESKYKF